MTTTDLYASHLQTQDQTLQDALERAGAAGVALDAVLFHAGRLRYYHADDHPVPFHSTPHFRRWVPLDGPEHTVLARPGKRPTVVRVRPRDYWYDTSPPPTSYWEEAVELEEVESFDDVAEALGDALPDPSRVAYVGPAPEAAAQLGIPEENVEPEALLKPLDWHRAYKTEWEVSRLRGAAERGAAGHKAAREAFLEGGSELEIHWEFLRASGHLEAELPFESIAALDDKAAILHYQHKRGDEAAPGKVLLMDAGAACEGYASDITRTWVRPEADALFVELLQGLDELQRELVSRITPGRSFVEVHETCHRLLAELMVEVGLVPGSAEEAFERGVTHPFLPHGLGHHLGLQVHDVGGHQARPEGGEVKPPEEYPALRNTRVIEPGQMLTVEPGIYFIPMLLEPLRGSDEGELVDWNLVERLAGHGGVRIEDDVLCTAEGPQDLTRALIAGPRGS